MSKDNDPLAPKGAPQGEGGNDYLMELLAARDHEKLRKYDEYVKQHNARLRRLRREADGELVPGDYDGGYE